MTWWQAGSAGEVLLYHIAECIHDLQSSLDGVGLVLWQGTGSDNSGGVGAARRGECHTPEWMNGGSPKQATTT